MRIKLTINKERRFELTFYIFMFYFFCLDYVYIVFPSLNAVLNSKLIGIVVMAYAMLILLKKLRHIPLGVCFLYIAAFLFILISMIINDKNATYILDSILTLNNIKQILILPLSIYAVNTVYKFNVRMYKFSYFAVIYYLMVYGLYFVNATIEGGFYGTYGMGLGFQATFFLLYILQHGFEKSNIVDFVSGAIFGIIIISFASRSVILIMGISILVNFYIYFGTKSKVKKLIVVLVVLSAGLILYMNFDFFIQGFIKLLSGFSNLGRTLWALKNSKWLFDSDGRNEIWSVCIREIKINPLSIRGIGGDVRILTENLGTGFYAHNFIIEILMEFGILIGTILIFSYIKMLKSTLCLHDIEKKKALLPLGIMTTTTLFFSLTCWTCPWFWMYIVLYLGWLGGKKKSNISKVGKIIGGMD